jgi:ATP-binding cassette, subfamily F, member 1
MQPVKVNGDDANKGKKAPPKKGKTSLELKLEKAKKEKEEADKIAAAEKLAREAAEREAAERAAAEKVATERAAAEKAARDAAAMANTGPDEESNPIEDEEDDEGDDENLEEGLAEEDPEKRAKLLSTMYGDDVFDEDARVPGDEKAATILGKKGKLSNRDRRKLAKLAEAEEREKEYQEAMMKASIAGAQFAVSQTTIDPNDIQWQNALDIVIPNFSISAHNKELFVNAQLTIAQGRRYGLVGPNGAGKSTLLKMISAGELKVPPRVDYLYVEQEVLPDDTPAVDAVLKADKVRWELVEEEKTLLKQLEINPEDDKANTRLGEVYEQLSQIGAAASESRARRILFGLGFDAEMQIRPTRYFSGGWRMRISLARALFMEPTLLMLDEPTNHLDLNAVIWLDDYLQKWKKTLLVVSHDQDFLNSVCEEILHLEQKKLQVYRGNYDSFKEQEETRHKQLIKDYEKQEKKLKELKSKGITKENAEKQLKQKSRESGARAEKKKQATAASTGGAESAESQITLIERPREYIVEFAFPEVKHLNPPILQVRDVHFRYRTDLPWLFHNLNFGLDMSSRVCIVGPNGSGKSTIIKLITDEAKPTEGEVLRNPRLRIGVYNQHFIDRLPMDESPVDYLRRLFNEETYQTIRNKLGKYGLEGHAHTIPIRDLSGGQKARVVFVELSLMAPHLLFLDEPTNNLGQ